MKANPDFGTIGGLSGDIEITDKDVSARADNSRNPVGPDILREKSTLVQRRWSYQRNEKPYCGYQQYPGD